jgi:hypothetical protein
MGVKFKKREDSEERKNMTCCEGVDCFLCKCGEKIHHASVETVHAHVKGCPDKREVEMTKDAHEDFTVDPPWEEEASWTNPNGLIDYKKLEPPKRESYAFQVLCSLITTNARLAGGYDAENMAKHSVAYTDALLEALSNTQPK